MLQKEILIIKLGGSVVTLKHLNRPAIRRLHVKKIASVIFKNYNPKKQTLILIHGAGSFGHLHAHRYDLTFGTKDHPEKSFRAIENQSLDAQLNSELVSLFIASGLPVVGMPTRTLATNTKGKLATLETKNLRAALSVGAVPLLHGDMIFDTVWGLSICSGDVLVSKLASIFSAEKVFFASDVDGIFTQDPHRFKNAELIQNTSLGEIIKGAFKLSGSHNKDVTGGLSKKFTLFQRNSSLKKIYLFNGIHAKNFSFVFDQKNFFGTTIQIKKTGQG